jgi:hypothetical protein
VAPAVQQQQRLQLRQKQRLLLLKLLPLPQACLGKARQCCSSSINSSRG